MSRVDLMSAPVVIELYPKDAPDYIDVECTGTERAKIANMGVRDSVNFVMEHYKKSSAEAKTIHEEIEEALTIEKYSIFRIYDYTSGIDFDKEGHVIADHTNEPINDSRFFLKREDEERHPYWLCEIRAFPQPDPLGGLEKVCLRR